MRIAGLILDHSLSFLIGILQKVPMKWKLKKTRLTVRRIGQSASDKYFGVTKHSPLLSHWHKNMRTYLSGMYKTPWKSEETIRTVFYSGVFSSSTWLKFAWCCWNRRNPLSDSGCLLVSKTAVLVLSATWETVDSVEWLSALGMSWYRTWLWTICSLRCCRAGYLVNCKQIVKINPIDFVYPIL